MSTTDALIDPTSLVDTHTYTPFNVRSVREMIIMLSLIKAEFVSEIKAVTGLWFPSPSTITQEIVGRGNPSTIQFNIAV